MAIILIRGLCVVSLTLVVACTTNPYTGETEASNKAKAAGIGALAGAVSGALSGDDADERRKRALIGAGVGALAGTAVGAYMDAQEDKLREQLARYRKLQHRHDLGIRRVSWTDHHSRMRYCRSHT